MAYWYIYDREKVTYFALRLSNSRLEFAIEILSLKGNMCYHAFILVVNKKYVYALNPMIVKDNES